MRAIHVALLGVLLLVVGLAFAIAGRLHGRLVQEDAETTATAPPPSTPARSSAEAGASAVPAAAGLACIQNALGGVQAFAGVSSLRIVGATKPAASVTGMRPVANEQEILVQFPDRYRRSDVQTDAPPGAGPMTSALGFDGNHLLFNLMGTNPPGFSASKEMRNVRHLFVQDMLMRLPRALPDVRLLERRMLDAGQQRLAIDAFDAEGRVATLLADARTCRPVGLEYIQPGPPAGFLDAGLVRLRVDLSDYRRFGAILIPTVLKYVRNGRPDIEERDSNVQVNPPLGAEDFRAPG